jgi:hypothetical protein
VQFNSSSVLCPHIQMTHCGISFGSWGNHENVHCLYVKFVTILKTCSNGYDTFPNRQWSSWIQESSSVLLSLLSQQLASSSVHRRYSMLLIHWSYPKLYYVLPAVNSLCPITLSFSVPRWPH